MNVPLPSAKLSVSPDSCSGAEHVADDGAAGDVDGHVVAAPALMSIAVPPVPVMVPELTMAPRNVATLFTTMPVCATIVPELLMSPEKVEMVTDAAFLPKTAVVADAGAAADQDAGAVGRDRAGIADAAGEGRDRD